MNWKLEYALPAAVSILAVFLVSGLSEPTEPAGRDFVDEHFTLSFECGVCHSVAPGANAMRSVTGDDVSPYGTWSATMMGNSFKDPYFHAQLQKETAATGEHVQELCLRCHAPMAHHHRLQNGEDPPRLADLEDDVLADDSVSCTMCHQISAEGLGEERTFSGKPVMSTTRELFGPFADPAVGPMQNHVNYTPVHSPHIQRSAVCGSCHTLVTHHQGVAFPEQTPYLEWRNSEFSDEDGATKTSRTCQQCHMPKTGATRVARNPMGLDFLIPVREDYSTHSFVGGNAFMLEMLRDNAEELGVTAEPEALSRMAAATRRQLGEDTAEMFIENEKRDGQRLTFDLRIENKTGHKFPTGYPARRAWVHLQVSENRRLLFETGSYDEDGRLVGVDDALELPHVDVVDEPSDVVVYEMIATDPDGRPTTFLTKMTGKRKDNRLLPRGWDPNFEGIDSVAPVGIGDDANFVGGSDTVSFDIELPEGANNVRIVAWLHYQSVPPVWVDALRDVDAEASRRFLRMYEAADKEPETVAIVARFVR
ncbi:MAG: hypothetical protein VYE77_01555 [Planctomycetota bacterium]|nr:hypothetical protein [Planctomycetota bacterium]